jgi:hypothetical protein
MADQKNELDEKNFIHEGVKDDPFPLIYWFIILVFIGAISWFISSWYDSVVNKEIDSSPFLQVTNREFSLFLWQNPEFMRIHVSDKASYLPAYNYIESLSMKPEMADDFVVAPPEILFKYHTWQRLLADEVPVQTVSRDDFNKFLEFAQEWAPTYWKEAPQSYISLIETLPQNTAPTLTVPLPVQQAYTGWKNFFTEGDAINTFQPTYTLFHQLVARYPHYAKNYWQNLIPDYMHSKETGEVIPQHEQPSFLKSALYNFSKLQ